VISQLWNPLNLKRISRWSLKTREAGVQISKSSERVHCYMESAASPDRGGPRDRPRRSVPLSLLVVIQPRIATGARYARGPFTHDEIRASCSETYARAPCARACIRVVRPAAFFSCPPFSRSVLLSSCLSARRDHGIPPRLALAPRRSMADAAGCLVSPPLSLSLSLCLRASALRVKVPLV